MKFTVLTFCLAMCLPPLMQAQNQNSDPNVFPSGVAASDSPGFVLAGGMVLDSTLSPGTQIVSPAVEPIFLVPFGTKLLLESEISAGSDFERDQGSWQPRQLRKEVEYLQLDYMLNNNLTIVVGRILTPFGMYFERYHPEWIRDLQVAPIIFGISHNHSMGAEIRGAAHVTNGVDVTYTGFYAINSTAAYFDGTRGGGGRVSVVFLHPRVEVGFSYNRRLGEDRFNLYAWDFTWNARSTPLDLRSEVFKTGLLGSGYWIEGAYRLNKISSNRFMRKSQIAFRGEQYFAPKQFPADQSMNMPGMDNFLPDRDTMRPFIGWNYYVTDGLKLSAAYGRSFASGENQNIYSLGITYRFTLGEK